MIPITLSIKNFMSYGDNVPPLDFSEFQLACLCGKNGHGKSAIIDAITWVLWGEGRKTSIEKKADEGLLKIGKTEMMVELVFDLEGDRFRVIRQYSKGGKTAKSSLEFDVFDSKISEYVTLTQKSISQTQAKINQFLRMDYDVFINSSALLQGRADEFATKKAGERKQLLADILGLSRYDELSDRARDKHKEANMRFNIIEEDKNKIENELSQKENVRERLNHIKEELNKLNSEMDFTEKELISLREKKSKLSFIKEQLTGIEEQIIREEVSLRDLKKQKLQIEEEAERLKKTIDDEKNITRSYEQYQELLKQEAIMVKKIQKTTHLRQRKNSLESKINQKKTEIEGEVKITGEKINSIREQLTQYLKIIEDREIIENRFFEFTELEKREHELEEKYKKQKELHEKNLKIEKCIAEKEGKLKIELGTLEKEKKIFEKKILEKESLEREIHIIKENLTGLENLLKKKEIIIQDTLEKKTKITHMEEQIKEMEKEIAEDREKWKTIRKTRESKCPLCDAVFDKERKNTTLEKIKKEGEIKKEKIDKVKKEMENLQKERTHLNSEHKMIEEQIERLQPQKNLFAQKEMELEDCKNSQKSIYKLEVDIQAIEKILTEKKYAEEEYENSNKIQNTIKELGYNERDVSEIKIQKEKLLDYRNLKIKLDLAVENQKRLTGELPELEKTLKEKEEILKKGEFSLDLKTQLEEVAGELDEIKYSEEEHNLIREQIKKLSKITTLQVILENAKEQLPSMLVKKEQAGEKLIKTEELLKGLQFEKQEKASTLSDLPFLEEEIPQKEASLYGMRFRVNDLTSEKGNLESIFENHKKLEIKRKELEEELEVKVKEKEIYKILHKAFGKDGIQALIIQNCIPEIEAEANKLLSRLTDNRIHVALELLRDKKSGGMKETLDIKISDEVGTRDYELYSGGEAFRTNFSLRVALAKLLARRAGTKLRTLIIDEGFGTQDTDGIEQLVQAIQEISKDFDKIIVITHMESLKNIFPTRIEVIKCPVNGSNFKVITN